MRSLIARMRGCTVWAVMATLIAVGGTFQTVPGVGADHAIALYRSEQFDYYFFYDASTWEIVEQASAPGSDVVQLANADVNVEYEAFEAHGQTPTECVGAFLEGIDSVPSVTRVEHLAPGFGPPKIDESEVQASVDIVITVDDQDGRSKFAASFSCQELVAGESLLISSFVVSATYFNEKQEFSFAHPWIIAYVPNGEPWVSADPIPIVGPGGVRGTLALSPQCASPGATQPSYAFYGVARNVTSSGTLIIDPLDFTNMSPTGDSVPVEVEWLYPVDRSRPSFMLEAGEIGLFKLSNFGNDEFSYSSGDGSSVSLGERCCGCAGGGTAPVIIDME